MIDDESLIQEFVSEGREHLTDIEPDFLILEREGANADPEVVNRVFRAIHSIKGASGFFGFEAIKQLSHIMENILMLIRDGKLQPTTKVVSPLLTGVDRLSGMLSDISASEQVPYSDVVQLLDAMIHAEAKEEVLLAESVPDPPAAEPKLQPSEDEINAAAKMGQAVYTIQFDRDKDVPGKNREPATLLQAAESLGNVLRSTIGDGSPESPLVILLASVLEADLIGIALEVPVEQVHRFSQAETLIPEETTISDPEDDILPESGPAASPEASAAPSSPAHVSQSATSRPKTSSGESPESIRVRVDLLNNLMNLAGELVLLRNQILRNAKEGSGELDNIGNTLQNLSLTTTSIQEAIMQTRMQPIGNILSRFRRLVRDTAQQLGKRIELEIIGEDVELDKSLLENLSDPLTHIIRNCCDHGIELPDVRLGSGKDETGRIRIQAYHEGGQINILIEDDGRGIDPDKVAKKAVQLGLVKESQLASLSPKDVINFIMLPGFSTAEQVSDLSGRGVGMDVVRTNIEKMGGSISIDSRTGQGTRLLLKLPLTLAIIPSLLVGVEQFRFAIPQLNLVELICVRHDEVRQKIEKLGHAEVLRLRGRLLPILRLADALGIERHYRHPETDALLPEQRVAIADRRQEALDFELQIGMPRGPQRRQQGLQDLYIAILNQGTNQYGLLVDQVLNLEEIVVKPLPTCLKSCRTFSGSTIMGDGKVAMILDATGLAEFARLAFNEANSETHLRETKTAQETDPDLLYQDVLLFNYAPDEVFAFPLCSILRIEKFNLQHIQQIGSQEYLPYQGKGLPLVRLDSHYPVRPLSADMEECFLIIPNVASFEFGIIASRILDTAQVSVRLQPIFDENQAGVAGAAIVQNRMTIFIEPEPFARHTGSQAGSLDTQLEAV